MHPEIFDKIITHSLPL